MQKSSLLQRQPDRAREGNVNKVEYKFSLVDILVAPYCFVVTGILSFFLGRFTEVTSELYIVLIMAAMVSSYPLFLKGKASYWNWIGEWTFLKWLTTVLISFAMAVILVSLFLE